MGYETWPRDAWRYIGGANNWAGMALDEARGILYAPTGSAAADFYGANRTGDNLFANSLLALDAATGKRIWHFQAVRHDIWDRDFPSQPSLVAVTRGGARVDAVAQTSKHGYVFLFDARRARPSSRSRSTRSRAAPWRARSRPGRSRSRPGPLPSRASGSPRTC
jgi:quinoprotein glucose dehydrogenase